MKNQKQQTAVQAMQDAFTAQGVTVSQGTFFGVPIQDYFGAPHVSEHLVALPVPQATNRAAANQMKAAFEAMGVNQLHATVFGIPIADYFGLPETGIWEKILKEVTAASSVSPAR